MDRLQENLIEWMTGQDTVTVTFSQKKYVNRIKRMSKKYPEKVIIEAENDDGSITAKIPLKAVHLTLYESKNNGFIEGDELTVMEGGDE